MHLTAVLCSFRQYPNLSLQLTQWTDGLNVGIFPLWRSWSLFYKEKAEDPILEFCSFDSVVVVVNMWFASIISLFIFCIFMVFILPRVILLLSNRDVRRMVMYYAVWSKLLVIRGFFSASWEFFASGDTFRWMEDTGSTYHLKRFICVRAVMRVCMYARVTVCMFWCMYASVLTL